MSPNDVFSTNCISLIVEYWNIEMQLSERETFCNVKDGEDFSCKLCGAEGFCYYGQNFFCTNEKCKIIRKSLGISPRVNDLSPIGGPFMKKEREAIRFATKGLSKYEYSKNSLRCLEKEFRFEAALIAVLYLERNQNECKKH